jgi:hypothetical protein
MTNTDSKTEIIDAILKNREIIKNRIHLKQFKEHLTKEEIKKLNNTNLIILLSSHRS